MFESLIEQKKTFEERVAQLMLDYNFYVLHIWSFYGSLNQYVGVPLKSYGFSSSFVQYL